MIEKNKLAYSVRELSEELTLSKSFIRNEIRAKKLIAKKIGRRVLILNEDVKKYLNSQQDFEGVKN